MRASLAASALMLLAGCAGYLTNYQTPCVQGHVCQCVQYTTWNRSWLDCPITEESIASVFSQSARTYCCRQLLANAAIAASRVI